MCMTRINTPAIANNIDSLSSARDVARKNKGSEVIVKDNKGNYSVHQLNPKDVDNIVKTKGGSIDPKGFEFVIEKQGGSNAILINKNADIFDKARSEIVSVNEKVSSKYEEVKEAFIDNAEKLFDNITGNKGKHNDYVKGGETVDISVGKVKADCSGFVQTMFEKSGITLKNEDMNAATIGKLIRDGKGPLKQITKASDIKPTDIITFDKNKGDKKWWSGHVMVSISTPRPIYDPKNGSKVIGYNVDIADSTSSAHSNDTRNRATNTGAGTGTISFSVKPDGTIKDFFWGQNLSMAKYNNNVTVGTLK